MATEITADTFTEQDEFWMTHALQLALRGTGRVSPNPRVGCVIVDHDTILGEGWHGAFGGPHAETVALQACSKPIPASAVMYVTLEPCNHTGKTPPCAHAIVEHGIQHVVVAMMDPHPLVSGRGIGFLKSQGVAVSIGCMRSEAEWLNRMFIHYATTGLPYVIVKTAESSDGFMAPDPKCRFQLTGVQSQRRVHQLRGEVDAVLTTASTVLFDNPRLDVRAAQGRNPQRVILDPLCKIPLESHVVQTAQIQRTILVAADTIDASTTAAYREHGCQIVRLPVAGPEQFHLSEVFAALGSRGIASVMCEAGPLFSSVLLTSGYVQEWYRFIAPTVLGRGSSIRPTNTWVEYHRELLGEDQLIINRPRTPQATP